MSNHQYRRRRRRKRYSDEVEPNTGWSYTFFYLVLFFIAVYAAYRMYNVYKKANAPPPPIWMRAMNYIHLTVFPKNTPFVVNMFSFVASAYLLGVAASFAPFAIPAYLAFPAVFGFQGTIKHLIS